MSQRSNEELVALVEDAFQSAGIELAAAKVRRFPGEVIIVAEVNEDDLPAAIALANDLDAQIENGFITVKKSSEESPRQAVQRSGSLIDPRVSDLIEMLNARSRTSEQQPSLRYIRDAAENLNLATSRRHHLIFGRRGVGKTALMLEAKKIVESRGAATFWINIQSMRDLPAFDAFLATASRLCDIPGMVHATRRKRPPTLDRAEEIRKRISGLLDKGRAKQSDVARLVPDLQQLFKSLSHETQDDLYLFIDDFHYLSMAEQPKFLDLVHGVTRDSATWIKAAGIKHQSRWFTDNPPTGLQTGHDATIIGLDVTLEQPAKARDFLVSILRTYTEQAKLARVFDAFSREAIDRLVLASGGVPRDFLILGATAIQVARLRPSARAAAVQDVNESAGKIAQTKLQELEDDAASSIGKAKSKVSALSRLKQFLIEEKQTTYFRVDFLDKEQHPKEYELMQSLMDLRLLHLIHSGLSDERHAGRRSEVYMLDLSQFSGTRLKRNLKVLDFTKGYLVLKSTGGPIEPRPGNTPKKLQGILRRGPSFDLDQLTASAGA